MTFSSSPRLIFSFSLTLAASLFLSSCFLDPNVRKQKYFESGQHYFDQGKYREALVEFINAIKIDPRYGEAHHQLAETYLKLQRPQDAALELARAVQLQPEDNQTRIELANLLILGHNLQEAQEQTDLLLQKRPNDPLSILPFPISWPRRITFPARLRKYRKRLHSTPPVGNRI